VFGNTYNLKMKRNNKLLAQNMTYREVKETKNTEGNTGLACLSSFLVIIFTQNNQRI